MKIKKPYSEQLEAWEQEAYSGGYGEDWLIDVGEGVKFYANLCEGSKKRPTFAGLMKHLSTMAKM